MIKAVIIDDEPKAIQGLSWELSNFDSDIEVIATFTEPEKALSYIKNTEIDCLFLDVEMPTMDGFQFIEKLDKKDFAIVITTAYNEYAIKAFKKEAIDYLLKPIDTDDLQETIEKVKKFNSRSLNNEKFERILLNFNEKLNHKKITISTDGKLIFLEPHDILYAESDGNYTTLFLQSNKKIDGYVILENNVKIPVSRQRKSDFLGKL